MFRALLYRLLMNVLMMTFCIFLLVVQTEAGRIGLEGCLCDDYYKIRELLYEQYAVV